MSSYFIGGVSMGNKLIYSFLEDPLHQKLYSSYLENPSEEKQKEIEEKFKLHVMKLKILSYFSKALFFEAQRFDEAARKTASSPLLEENDEDVITTSQVETINEPLLENYFENERLFNLVSKLNDNNKQLLYLLYVKELDESQVAAKLGVTKQAVNKRKNSLLKKIRQLYYK